MQIFSARRRGIFVARGLAQHSSSVGAASLCRSYGAWISFWAAYYKDVAPTALADRLSV